MTKKLNTILLVDDDDATNYLHKFIIEEADVTENILVALNGEEALNLLKSNHCNNSSQPELIFLDINMPRMNGWEFLKEYQKFDNKFKNKHIIVMLTVSLNPDDAIKAGTIPEISGFRNKPLTVQMISEIIKQLNYGKTKF